MSRLLIRALDSSAASSKFDCDEPLLNVYLLRYAGQDVKRGVARAFIATPDEAPEQIAGFFTLSAASVQSETLPESWRKQLPRYPVLVALLGRLAGLAGGDGTSLYACWHARTSRLVYLMNYRRFTLRPQLPPLLHLPAPASVARR